MPSARENKEVVERFLRLMYGEGDADAFDELVAPDARFVGVGGEVQGLDEIKEAAARLHSAIHTAFPDFEITLEELVAEGSSVAAFFVEEGTFTGPYQMGPTRIEPTGKRARVLAMELFHLEEGKITERWATRDRLGLLQQIGAPVQIG